MFDEQWSEMDMLGGYTRSMDERGFDSSSVLTQGKFKIEDDNESRLYPTG